MDPKQPYPLVIPKGILVDVFGVPLTLEMDVGIPVPANLSDYHSLGTLNEEK